MLKSPNGVSFQTTTKKPSFKANIYDTIGNYSLLVSSKGQNNNQGHYFDSDYSSTGIFIVYNNDIIYDRPFLNSITII
jgi:hypothetical protein